MLVLALSAMLAQAPVDAAAPAKKDVYLETDGELPGRAPARAGQRAEQPIWAHNLRTHEIRVLTGVAGFADGAAGQAARSEFFRCWFTHGHGPIPAELVGRITAAATHFGVREVQIISGFRHPKYNLLLRKKGREVAETSEHTEGHAIDFLLPGVATRTLYDWLLARHGGGVGFYPVSGFVHIDIGRKRTWRGT